MAKRSDFAQKLLDDLRLRKERMNSSHKSSQSNQPPIDAYAYSKQTHRGSRSYKGSEIVSSRTGNMVNRSSRSHRSAKVGEVSNQIVPYGRGQTGDMSLALAFPFENGGKLRRTDASFTSSIMSFLSQLKRGTINFGKMERRGDSGRQLVSTSHFPALSPVQINEIYKGAQKLNQILSASHAKGLTIDRHSIEFAKELLQGAINLEESLRMIVGQQKNPEFIATTQKKNRIILLEEEEEDGEEKIETLEKKQLAPPIFSFDKLPKHSRNLQGNQNTSVMKTNFSKGKKLNNEKQDVNTSKLLSHKRSTSYGSDMKNLNALSEQNNQLASEQSNEDRSRIPNVVAKLMGLDNLPEKGEVKYTPQKDSGSAQKIEGMTSKHTSKGSSKKNELKNKQTENSLPQKKQKVIEATTVPTTQYKELMFGADKSLNMRKTTIKKDKQHDSAAKVNLTRESRIGVQEKGTRQDHINNREQKSTGKGRTNDLLLNNMLNQMEQAKGRSEVKSLLQEEKETSGSTHQSEKRHINKHILGNQKMSQNHLGIQKSNLVLKNGPQEDKHHKEQRLQQSEKQMLKERSQKGSETTTNNLSKPPHELFSSQKKQLFINQVTPLKHNSAENSDAMNLGRFSISYYDDLIRDEVSSDLTLQIKEKMKKESSQFSSPRDQESEQVKEKRGILKGMVEKSVHKIADNKVKSTRKQNIDMPGKIDEVLTRRNGMMLHIPKQIKHQNPIMQQVIRRTSDKLNISKEAERERVGPSTEADTRIISSNAPVATIEPLDVRYRMHKDERPPPLYNPDGGELQSSQDSVALVPNYLLHGEKSPAIRDLQDQTTLGIADEEFKSCQIAPYTINGMHEDRMGINSHLQVQDQNISVRSPKPLTESENYLKCNLVKSQLFLNTAHSLFRLDMPFSNHLQGSGWDNQDSSSKLLLDCGYEVMKRKGIRQEFKGHPCSKISVSTIKIGSLDDLVRKLNEDIEKLTFYGRSRNSPVEVEDYLPKMLENDLYSKDPDIDCMWELGWNDDTFAFIEKYEAIRNMEKLVLNGLLDEITTELWHFQGLNMTATNSAE